MSRLKVLMFAYAVDNKDVGEAHLTYCWIQEIAKVAHITLITMGSRINNSTGLEENPNVKLHIIKPSITFRWTGAFDRVFKPDYPEVFYKARNAAKLLLKHNTFDALHHIAPHSPRYPSPFLGLHKNLLVGPLHGGLALPKAFSTGGNKTKISRALRKLDTSRYSHDPVINRHFKSARKLLISAPYVADIIPEEYQKKTLVIPPQPPEASSVTPIDKTNITSDSTIKVLFVGRLIESKGIRYAIESLKGINKEKYHFTVFGAGEQKELIQDLVKKFQLENNVTLAGFVDHGTVLEAMQTHDIFLFPSLKEAWGLVVTEAMQSGLAIICVDRGGPGYMIDERCGIKVPATTPDQLVKDLTNALNTLLTNPELIRQYGDNAKQKVTSEFTWPAITSTLVDLYSQEDSI